MNIKRLFTISGSILLGLTIILIWLLFGPPILTRAASYTVCPTGTPTCDYSSVQDAVDAASDGDVIKVAAGTYTGINNKGGLAQVVYLDKSVTIRGGYTTTNWTTSDPVANPTTLDAQGGGRVLYITGTISPTIEGLRITGGDSNGLGGWGEVDVGGGVFIHTATAVIRDNQIFANAANSSGYDVGGGGVCLYQSDATLDGNTISDNTAQGSGGGLYLFESDATLSSNTISGNNAQGSGGGLYLFESDATLSSNTISGNNAQSGGGGLFLINSPATLNGNTISANHANSGGGGMYVDNSAATLTGNTVSFNTATGGGGGLVLLYSGATLTNNAITDNQANNSSGVAISAGWTYTRLLHTTIARNHGGDGAGITITTVSPKFSVYLTNTILVNQTVGIYVESHSTAILQATLWGDGAWANGIDWAGDGTISTTANHWGNPDFVDPDAGDYHIGPDSDAIDQGVDAGVTNDIDQHPRPYQEPDIGADEYWPPGALKFITVTVVGNGLVNNTPGNPYIYNEVATLEPVADSGWYFGGWSGPDAGELVDNGDGTWSITMDGNKAVTATFTQEEYNIYLPIITR